MHKGIGQVVTLLAMTWALGVEGCAHVAPGYPARPLDAQGKPLAPEQSRSGLRIVGREITELGSPYFGFVELTFINESGHWVRVHRMQLSFGDPIRDQSVFVPWGMDIQTWQHATALRNEVRAANTQTALEVLALAGTAAATFSQNRGVKAVGGAVALSSIGALTALEYDARVKAAQSSPIFPESHLLAVPFGVPPGLFAKKWIVLNTVPERRVCIRSMLLDYESDAGGRERAWLTFRKRASASQWQNDCDGTSADRSARRRRKG
jgi:hypothetical protein